MASNDCKTIKDTTSKIALNEQLKTEKSDSNDAALLGGDKEAFNEMTINFNKEAYRLGLDESGIHNKKIIDKVFIKLYGSENQHMAVIHEILAIQKQHGI